MSNPKSKPSAPWSDCAIYNGPAYPPGPCNCGGLELTQDSCHFSIPALVAGPGGVGLLLKQSNPDSLVNTQQFPANRLVVNTSTPDLPDTHHGVTSGADSNGVDLNISRK